MGKRPEFVIGIKAEETREVINIFWCQVGKQRQEGSHFSSLFEPFMKISTLR